jgi:hypothetical protein
MADEQKRVSPQEYEFTEDENDTITIIAHLMRFVGTGMIGIGALLGVFSGIFLIAIMAHTRADPREALLLVLLALQTFACGFAIMIGFWLRGASESFQQIVNTRGNDIANLMEALHELGRVYGVQRILLVLGGALGVIGLGVVFIASGGFPSF